MPNTAKGLPYPAPTEPVAAGAAAIQALAEGVDARLALRELRGSIDQTGTVVAGAGFTCAPSGGSAYNVTFSTAFSAPPIVLVTLNGGYALFGIENLSAAGFRVIVNGAVGFHFVATSVT